MLQSSRKINATGIITEVCKEYKEGFKKKGLSISYERVKKTFIEGVLS